MKRSLSSCEGEIKSAACACFVWQSSRESQHFPMTFSQFGVFLSPRPSMLSNLSLCLPTLLISPQTLIFVPCFISFLLVSFSPPHLSFLHCYSREYSQCGAERFGAGGGQSRRLFPLHFTQGLEMRQTQLQTDEALLRVPRGACGSGTDHFGRMGNLLKGSVDFVKHCWANCILFLLGWVLVQARTFNSKMYTCCVSVFKAHIIHKQRKQAMLRVAIYNCPSLWISPKSPMYN